MFCDLAKKMYCIFAGRRVTLYVFGTFCMVFFLCFFLAGCGAASFIWGSGTVRSFPSNDVTFLTFFSLFYYVDDATLLTSSLDVNTSMMIRSCLSSLDLMVVTPLPSFGGVGSGGRGWGHNNVLSFPSNDVTFLTFFSLFYYVDDVTCLAFFCLCSHVSDVTRLAFFCLCSNKHCGDRTLLGQTLPKKT